MIQIVDFCELKINFQLFQTSKSYFLKTFRVVTCSQNEYTFFKTIVTFLENQNNCFVLNKYVYFRVNMLHFFGFNQEIQFLIIA